METLPAVFGLCGLVLGFYVGKWRERHRGEDLFAAAAVSLKKLYTRWFRRGSE